MSELAGYQCHVSLNGPTTAAAGEACVAIADDAAGRKRYQVTNALHRIFDPAFVPVVYENGVAVLAANLFAIDFQFAIITFVLGHVPAAPVTSDIHWQSKLDAPGAFDVKLSRKNTVVDNTKYAQGDRQKRKAITLMEASVAIKGKGTIIDDYDSGTIGVQSVDAAVNSGTPILVEINPGAGDVFRGRFVADTDGQNLPLNDLASYDLSVQSTSQDPNSYCKAGFSWGTP